MGDRLGSPLVVWAQGEDPPYGIRGAYSQNLPLALASPFGVAGNCVDV